jgi:hypothetical protein
MAFGHFLLSLDFRGGGIAPRVFDYGHFIALVKGFFVSLV